MATVELEDQEWQQVINIIATAPWRDANSLLMKIGNQLRTQQAVSHSPLSGVNIQTDGKEADHG